MNFLLSNTKYEEGEGEGKGHNAWGDVVEQENRGV